MRFGIAFSVVSLCFGGFSGFYGTVLALPPIPQYVQESLAEKPEFKAYLEVVTANSDKCISCHTAGADKKGRGHGLNDFGKVFHKHLDDKAFMAEHKAKNSAKALELFNEAWNKSLDAKNAAGEPFGDLMRAGKLPGMAK